MNQTGATVVEFAVIASILFVILFGILEFGLIFMQEHFVANAAREGLRVGIRANNYDEFTELGDEDADIYNYAFSDQCDSELDRAWSVDCQIRDYLTFWTRGDIGTIVHRSQEDPDDPATLTVKVKVPNFYPPILTSLVSLIPGAGFTLPEEFSFKVTGEYEDSEEP